MKIVASTLAGIEYSLENAFVFIESLGLDYAELVHQFCYNLKYSIRVPFMDVNIASL